MAPAQLGPVAGLDQKAASPPATALALAAHRGIRQAARVDDGVVQARLQQVLLRLALPDDDVSPAHEGTSSARLSTRTHCSSCAPVKLALATLLNPELRQRSLSSASQTP